MNGPVKYAVTVNCNTIEKGLTPGGSYCVAAYRDSVDFMRANGELLAISYEIGKQGRCHLHATWSTVLKRWSIHKGLKKENYFYECEPVRNVRAWNTYIRKDQPKEFVSVSVKLLRRLV